jgi:hypothetical protein
MPHSNNTKTTDTTRPGATSVTSKPEGAGEGRKSGRKARRQARRMAKEARRKARHMQLWMKVLKVLQPLGDLTGKYEGPNGFLSNSTSLGEWEKQRYADLFPVFRDELRRSSGGKLTEEYLLAQEDMFAAFWMWYIVRHGGGGYGSFELQVALVAARRINKNSTLPVFSFVVEKVAIPFYQKLCAEETFFDAPDKLRALKNFPKLLSGDDVFRFNKDGSLRLVYNWWQI